MNHLTDDRLMQYAFDLLETPQRADLSSHLETCDDCRNRLEAIQRQFAVLDVLGEDQTLPEELLQKTLAQKPSPPIPFYRRVWVEWLAVAAAVVLIFTVLLQNLPDTRIARPVPMGLEQPVAQSNMPDNHPALTGTGAKQPSRPSATPPLKGGELNSSPPAKGQESVGWASGPPSTVTAENGGPQAHPTTAKDRSPKGESLSSLSAKGQSPDRGEGVVRVVAADEIPDTPPFAPASAIELVVLPTPDKTQVTIYNSADLTLVRDTRNLTLKPGWNWLQFMWDGTLIDPTSLSLTPLAHADKIDIQQLVYPARLKDIGRWLIRSEVEGAVPFEITYFASGLSWRAFYMGTLNADETAMNLKGYVNVANHSGQDFKNAQTRLIVGEVHLLDTIADLARRQRPYGPDILNEERVTGYSWHEIDGKLKLGDELVLGRYITNGPSGGFGGGAYFVKEIEKQALSEYFLYTIEGTEDLPNTWAKRLPSFDTDAIPVKSLYKYDEDRYGTDTVRFVSFANDTEHELGETPIPEGSVKLYRSLNAAQNLSYIGAADIKYIPVNEDAELNLGPARRVTIEPVLMDYKTDNYIADEHGDFYTGYLYENSRRVYNMIGCDEIETWQLKLTNTRDIPVDIEITRNFGTDYWDIDTSSAENVEYKKHDKTRARFTLTLPARTEQTFAYTVTKYQGQRSEAYTKQQKPAITEDEEADTLSTVDETIKIISENKEESPRNITELLNLTPSSRTENLLAQTADFSFLHKDMPLEEAFSKISQLTDPPLAFVVMWGWLSNDAYVEKDTRIEFSNPQNLSISDGLDSLLDAISDGAFDELHYFIKDDVIVISTGIAYYFYEDQTAERSMPAFLKQQISIPHLSADTTFKDAIEQISRAVNPPLPIKVLWEDLNENAFIEPDTHIGLTAQYLPPLSVDFTLRLLFYGTISLDSLNYAYDDTGIIIATRDTINELTDNIKSDNSVDYKTRD